MALSGSKLAGPNEHDAFPGQCRAYVRTCPTCGSRFQGQDTCPQCGGPRPRCQRRRMHGEDVCRSHAFGRPYTLYRLVASRISDIDLEEFLEKDDGSLHQEYALAKIVIAEAFSGPEAENYNGMQRLEMLRVLFEIAEKKKRIEEGLLINVRMDSTLVRHIRKETRRIIKSFAEVIGEVVPSLRSEILFKVKERMHLPGNIITTPIKVLEEGGTDE